MKTTPAAHQTYLATQHFASLDGVRFLCISAVLWHHAPIWTSWSEPARIATRGFLGVDFFFVLSGFLITTLLLRERSARGTFSLRHFYWRRALRILPIYFLLVTVVAAYYIGVKGETQYLDILPVYFLFLVNFLPPDLYIPLLFPTWSLSVEEQYYVLWPLLLLLVPKRAILPVLGVLILLNLLVVTGALSVFGVRPWSVGPLSIFIYQPTYIPIILGSLLALLLHDPRWFSVLHRLCGFRFAPLAYLALLVLCLAVLPVDLRGMPGLALHVSMMLFLAALVVREDHLMRPALSVAPVRRIGQISYGIYLYHSIGYYIAALVVTKAGLWVGWPNFVICWVVTLVISELSFRYFESPILRLKNRRSGDHASSSASQ